MTKSRGLTKMPPRGAKSAFVEQAVAYSGDECLLWPYHRNWSGYGLIQFRGQRNYRVHRIVCERVHGVAPPDQPECAHSCGNPACVAPNHLRWASARENNLDRVKHGTIPLGPDHGLNKLTISAALAIRASSNRSQKDLAEEFGVTQSVISNIRQGKEWAWLAPSQPVGIALGRAKGSRHRLSKLTEDDIPRIRALAKTGLNNDQISKQFGVHEDTIRDVLKGRSWAWLREEPRP